MNFDTWALAALLPGALLWDALLGEPPARFHPVCFMGAWAERAEELARRFWGNGFGPGTVAALSTVLPFAVSAWCLTALAGSALLWGDRPEAAPAAWLAAVAISGLCLAPRSLAGHALAVARPLEADDVDTARKAVSMLVGRDTGRLDRHGIARACVESVGENLTDGVLSTLFWAGAGGLLGGAPGAAAAATAHRVSNVLDAMWGKRNQRYRRFGTWAARTDDALNLVPARLALPVIVLAAALLGLDAGAALRQGWKDRRAHASPNSAWSEAAFAGALGLRLGGPVTYRGQPAGYPWMGRGRPEAEPADIRAAVRLMLLSSLLFATAGSIAVVLATALVE